MSEIEAIFVDKQLTDEEAASLSKGDRRLMNRRRVEDYFEKKALQEKMLDSFDDDYYWESLDLY